MRNERGYTLIVVVVLLAVLLVLGAGAIRMAGSEVAAASGNRRNAAMAACAKAARDVMIGQLRFANPIPTSFSMKVATGGVAMNGDSPSGDVMLEVKEGHGDDMAPARAEVKSVEFITDDMLGKGKTPTAVVKMTNNLPGGAGGGMGGSGGARVTARCTDAAGRTQEVEFLIRYGI